MKTKNSIRNFFSDILFKLKNFFIYNPKGKNPRAWELDLLRGIVLAVVTFDHCCFFSINLNLLPYTTEFGQKITEFCTLYNESDFRRAVQPFGLFLLCFLSGINCSFTHSKFVRVVKFWIICGIYMGGFYLLHLLFPDYIQVPLSFNIIAVLTICFTIWAFLDLIHCPDWIRMGISLAVILLGLTYFYKHFISDNDCFVYNDFLALMVYNQHGFELSINNFEPLLPHLGFFIFGGVLGKYLYKDKKSLAKKEKPCPILYPILLVGKHSLSMYLFAPVVILAIALGVFKIVHLFI